MLLRLLLLLLVFFVIGMCCGRGARNSAKNWLCVALASLFELPNIQHTMYSAIFFCVALPFRDATIDRCTQHFAPQFNANLVFFPVIVLILIGFRLFSISCGSPHDNTNLITLTEADACCLEGKKRARAHTQKEKRNFEWSTWFRSRSNEIKTGTRVSKLNCSNWKSNLFSYCSVRLDLDFFTCK